MAEWRFLRFIVIVTVNCFTWKVKIIGISLPPFQVE